MNTHKFTGDMADQVEKDRDELVELRAKCERLEGDNKELDALAEEYRLKIPTTAQAMAYMSLLQKNKELEVQCAEMRSALEKCLRWPQVSKNEHLNGVQRALSTDCGKAILARLEEARRLLARENWPVTHEEWEQFHTRRDQWLKGGKP